MGRPKLGPCGRMWSDRAWDGPAERGLVTGMATFVWAVGDVGREGVSVGRLQRLARTARGWLRDERFRQWGINGDPAPTYRRIVEHPVVTTLVVAVVVGAILVATFGVPPAATSWCSRPT